MNNTVNISSPTPAAFTFEISKLALIIFAAIFASSLSELISYFLLYRKDDYKYNNGTSSSTQPKSKNSTKSYKNSKILT